MGKAQDEKAGGIVEMQKRFSLYDISLDIRISIDQEPCNDWVIAPFLVLLTAPLALYWREWHHRDS